MKADVRRRSPTWDRMKFIVLILFFLGVSVSAKVNAPFTTFAQALQDTWNETFGRILIVALPVEILRQIHYYVSEKVGSYNRFWSQGFFGGMERQAHRRFKPWTRFRLGRYIRIMVFLLILGAVVDYFVADVSSPIEALVQLPRILARNLQQFIMFLFYPLFLILQFGALFWFLSRGGVDTVMPEEIETRYSDVWGQDHVLDLVQENVGFLERPDEIEAKGGYIPGGILLWGPPGTGKTLIAEATAGEVGIPFVFVEPGAFVNMFMGVGILKVKGLFRKLRKLALRHGGVIVFFDEADALGSRGGLAQGGGPPQPAHPLSDIAGCNGPSYLSAQSMSIIEDGYSVAGPSPAESDNPGPGTLLDRIIVGGGMGGGGMGTLQALLTEISGLQKPRGISNKFRKMLGMKPKPPPKYRIFIMMATNLPSVLDPALLRPGRIDRIYKVGYPTKEGRKRTFEGYLAKVEHSLTKHQIDELAAKTPYYSGAKVKDLVNEALILAKRDDRDKIRWEDIWKAKTLKEMGPAEGFEYVEREEFAVAIHEASHAVAAHLLKAHHNIDVATIERRGDVGGFVSYIALEDRFVQWKTELEVDIKVSLASLAGERMFFDGDNSMGVGGDLRNGTTIASRMIGVWGMGENLASSAGLPQHALDQPPDPTGEIAKGMNSQVERRLRRLYDEVYGMIEEHQSAVFNVAVRLQQKKTISGDEVARIIGVEAGAVTKRKPVGFAAVSVDDYRHTLGPGGGSNGPGIGSDGPGMGSTDWPSPR
ncbi:MAG: AAA family ATPase [bacterium]|nr:AAA family ATPase [bacterium]MDE0289647.1 AAA family ATPase [bacterium]MDE0437921.1 AAA family ATPase [bacterium]